MKSKITNSLGWLGNRTKIISFQLTLLAKWLIGLIIWGINVFILIFAIILQRMKSVIRVFITHTSDVIGGSLPRNRKDQLKQMLTYAGIKMRAEEVLSITMIYSVIFLFIGMIVTLLAGKPLVMAMVLGLLSLVVVWLLLMMTINLLIYRRTESVENALPDILDMIAQNMISGMTAYNSLWVAARPEFGPLAVEIQSAAKATLAGASLGDALNEVTTRIKSDKLERSIKLIIQGMKSGGELPSVLQGVSIDMRAERNLRKQMKAETSAYALFIIFTLLVGTPLLFSISLQFVTIFSKLFEETGVAELAHSVQFTSMRISPLGITPEFFMQYTIITILVLAVFGSFLIGLIRTGEPISGIQNVPAMVIMALSIFLILNYVLTNVFRSVMGI